MARPLRFFSSEGSTLPQSVRSLWCGSSGPSRPSRPGSCPRRAPPSRPGSLCSSVPRWAGGGGPPGSPGRPVCGPLPPVVWASRPPFPLARPGALQSPRPRCVRPPFPSPLPPLAPSPPTLARSLPPHPLKGARGGPLACFKGGEGGGEGVACAFSGRHRSEAPVVGPPGRQVAKEPSGPNRPAPLSRSPLLFVPPLGPGGSPPAPRGGRGTAVIPAARGPLPVDAPARPRRIVLRPEAQAWPCGGWCACWPIRTAPTPARHTPRIRHTPP
jgi:hypothetical protein